MFITVYPNRFPYFRTNIKIRGLHSAQTGRLLWLTQRAYQAAEVIAAVNKINRSTIVPEYSFSDARGPYLALAPELAISRKKSKTISSSSE
ncbi:hypothetical protein ACET3Z_006099 [Daucus carota]